MELEHGLSVLLQLYLHSSLDVLRGLDKDNCKTRQGSFKFGDLVRLILQCCSFYHLISCYLACGIYVYRDVSLTLYVVFIACTFV